MAESQTRKTRRPALSWKPAPDVIAALDRLAVSRHGGNKTAALEALVREASRPTLTLVQSPHGPGIWIPETVADHRMIIPFLPGCPVAAHGGIVPSPELLRRAAELGITVVFRAEQGGADGP